MYKLSFLAAALAAGVMNFVVSTAHSEPMTFRRDEGRTVKVERTVKPAVTRASATKGKSAGKSTAGKSAGKATAGKAAGKAAARTKKSASRRKAGRTKIVIDTTTTASIPRAASAAPASGAAPYSAIIARYAASYGVPVSLAHAVVKVESNYRPNTTGSAGEVGLMQIKPATARMLGYSGSVKGLYDPETNIKYGMKYLAMAHELGGGTTCGTILKYNAGHGAKRMNPVSSAYCSKVKVQMAAAATPA